MKATTKFKRIYQREESLQIKQRKLQTMNPLDPKIEILEKQIMETSEQLYKLLEEMTEEEFYNEGIAVLLQCDYSDVMGK